ncbi:HXXEE domain-containing protein [Phenylobacterium sp.]|uniref:HXXEE domain-containing protein n=1 Tax=Phenylobacterium sp. TaxID=1871053 RepID=UPI002F939AE3
MLLLAALSLHNLEEALTYAGSRPRAAALIGWFQPGLEAPEPASFHAALLLVSLGAAVLLLWAAHTQAERAGWLAVRATALVLLVNVFVPHVPAAIAFGGYAPGVVTALAVNLPLGLWLLTRPRPRP